VRPGYKMQVVQCIGLREVCTVVENGASQAVTARKVMVDFARVEVLVPNLAGRYAVVSNISEGSTPAFGSGQKPK